MNLELKDQKESEPETEFLGYMVCGGIRMCLHSILYMHCSTYTGENDFIFSGLPASSAPVSKSSEVAPVPSATPVKKPAFTPLPSTRPAKEAVKTELGRPAPVDPPPAVPCPAAPTEKPQGEINSSTHRAAHARLVRKMERCDEAKFPHMAKLWQGSRKDYRGPKSFSFFITLLMSIS